MDERTVEAGTGPLRGITVLDLSALGPGPFCSMLLADFGADVIAVERPDPPPFDPATFFSRGKRSVVVDLRAEGGAEVIAALADRADVLLESNRPGTMERRGLGPDVLCTRNPRLIYTRLTGWGQDGPYADKAGHDVNYLAVSGALGSLGGPGDPSVPDPPLAMLGDLSGGSLTAAYGIVMALFERANTGRGQVIDAAIADGAAVLNMPQLGELNAKMWPGRGRQLLSGAAPFYGVYPCSDGGLFSVGAIEPKFYEAFLAALGIDDEPLQRQFDARNWDTLRARVTTAFAGEPRSHWEQAFAGVDACGAPVLELDELADDPHLAARGTVVRTDYGVAAAPAPRLSETPGAIRARVHRAGQHTEAVLAEAGYDPAAIADLVARGVVQA